MYYERKTFFFQITWLRLVRLQPETNYGAKIKLNPGMIGEAKDCGTLQQHWLTDRLNLAWRYQPKGCYISKRYVWNNYFKIFFSHFVLNFVTKSIEHYNFAHKVLCHSYILQVGVCYLFFTLYNVNHWIILKKPRQN